jgi:excisionase family DNA binding protein
MTEQSVPKMEDELLTTEQLADYLHVAVQTLHQWRWTDSGPPGIKVGRRVLYRRSAVEAWLAKRASSQAV